MYSACIFGFSIIVNFCYSCCLSLLFWFKSDHICFVGRYGKMLFDNPVYYQQWYLWQEMWASVKSFDAWFCMSLVARWEFNVCYWSSTFVHVSNASWCPKRHKPQNNPDLKSRGLKSWHRLRQSHTFMSQDGMILTYLSYLMWAICF